MRTKDAQSGAVRNPVLDADVTLTYRPGDKSILLLHIPPCGRPPLNNSDLGIRLWEWQIVTEWDNI